MTQHDDRTTPNTDFGRPEHGFRRKLHDVIFGIHTPAGRTFDLILITLIAISVLSVMLDSVASWRARYGDVFNVLEWVFTALFTIEYIARIACAPRRWRYIFSFYGIVDLVAILPT
ncbi:MAG: ion transporter, partial [Planctomycetes bacterium]|nr:ion transporter [Planctomycetota bacterium]